MLFIQHGNKARDVVQVVHSNKIAQLVNKIHQTNASRCIFGHTLPTAFCTRAKASLLTRVAWLSLRNAKSASLRVGMWRRRAGVATLAMTNGNPSIDHSVEIRPSLNRLAFCCHLNQETNVESLGGFEKTPYHQQTLSLVLSDG